jgi:hypothetical protein
MLLSSLCNTRVSYIGRAKNMATHSLVRVARIMGVLHKVDTFSYRNTLSLSLQKLIIAVSLILSIVNLNEPGKWYGFFSCHPSHFLASIYLE